MGLLSKLLGEETSKSPEQLQREADEELKQVLNSSGTPQESPDEESDFSQRDS